MRWIGVSNFNVEQMKRAMKIAPITSLAAAVFSAGARRRRANSSLRARERHRRDCLLADARRTPDGQDD